MILLPACLVPQNYDLGPLNKTVNTLTGSWLIQFLAIDFMSEINALALARRRRHGLVNVSEPYSIKIGDIKTISGSSF